MYSTDTGTSTHVLDTLSKRYGTYVKHITYNLWKQIEKYFLVESSFSPKSIAHSEAGSISSFLFFMIFHFKKLVIFIFER
jgi:hypothetical protein